VSIRLNVRMRFRRARAAHPASRAATRTRDGMTLIEVMIATVILGGALMSLAGFVAKFAHTVSDADIRGVAAELAADRIETVKAATQYATIDSLYETTEGRGTIVGYPKFTRQTLVQRVGGGATDLVDYRIITVIVMAPPLRTPVRKTTIISDF
jgi:prepilin-type N-terminal cleavage/methylation domain-containing protein